MTGLLAGFGSEPVLRQAMDDLTMARIGEVEAYTPMPLSADPGGSPLPGAMFIAGVLGFVGFFLLMTYANVHAYPLNIGGRPQFAWPTYVPIAFELGVLCAMATGFFGFFLLCRMPQLYDPIDACESFRGASRDGWFVAIRCTDSTYLAQARTILAALEPTSIEEFGG
jgi:hypothetical protein